MSQEFYHFNALLVGGIAGVGTLGGILLLIYRRRTTGPVFMATTRNDKTMYVVLTAAIVFGLWTTLASVFEGEHGHNYRETVAPWFRSLFIFQPDIAAMAAAPFSFHLHTLVGMALFVIWPFTRLVHAFTAPFHYLFRPYIVYRSRDRDRAEPEPKAQPARAELQRSPRGGAGPPSEPGTGTPGTGDPAPSLKRVAELTLLNRGRRPPWPEQCPLPSPPPPGRTLNLVLATSASVVVLLGLELRGHARAPSTPRTCTSIRPPPACSWPCPCSSARWGGSSSAP